MAADPSTITPWHRDEKVTLYLGDAATVLAQLPAGSVDCVVTSPPYYATRDWGAGQIGEEPTPAAYLDALRTVFREVHRVLRDDGTCWLNVADTYAAGPAARRRVTAGLPPAPTKSLLGLPWRLVLGLQEDGWLIRNEVIWTKPNAIPENVRDRFARRHETIYVLAKQGSYHFDLDALREPYSGDRTLSRRAHHGGNKPHTLRSTWPPTPHTAASHGSTTGNRRVVHDHGRIPGTVWTIPTRPSRGAHTAAFPIDIPLRCIAAGSQPGAVVLDPFVGSGTTLEAALRLGRQGLGIDVGEDFHVITQRRLQRMSRPAVPGQTQP